MTGHGSENRLRLIAASCRSTGRVASSFVGPVSVPEKTLEHWSSQYLNYRFKSKASLWWPAVGEDVNIAWLPRRPGKAVQLELKTTTVSASGYHDAMIDVRQLREYLQLPLSHQRFYAFPSPTWVGELKTAVAGHGISATELAYQRSGRQWWFAEWMVVMTAAEVARALHPRGQPGRPAPTQEDRALGSLRVLWHASQTKGALGISTPSPTAATATTPAEMARVLEPATPLRPSWMAPDRPAAGNGPADTRADPDLVRGRPRDASRSGTGRRAAAGQSG